MSLQYREVLRVGVRNFTLEKFDTSLTPPRKLVATLKPAGVVFSPGITEAVKQTANDLGIITEVLRYPSSEVPSVTVQFPGVDINAMEYKLGREFERGATTGIFAGTDFLERTNEIPGASTPDQFGYGVQVDDSDAIASVFRNNQTVRLNRVAWSSAAPPSGTDQFMVGAHGERKYSANLLAEKATVHYSFPLPLSNVMRLTTKFLSPLSLSMGLLTVNGQVVIFRAPNVQPVLEGDVDFGADSLPVTYRINASGCLSYEIIYSDQVVFCA